MGDVSYAEFLASKAQYGEMSGFSPTFMPSFLFDFQAATVDWNVRMGRSADFLDCGMGKTPIELNPEYCELITDRLQQAVFNFASEVD